MRFSVCWWNTGVAPPRGEVNVSTHLAKVIDTVKVLIAKRDVDFLCLGEVDKNSISAIKGALNSSALSIVDLSADTSGTKFHMGLVYKKAAVTLTDVKYHHQYVEMAKYKLGQSYALTLRDGSNFSIFAVHWPSRLRISPESHTRVILGNTMRAQIDQLLEADPTHKIIVLGDFNDEPYNDSVARTLAASRDIGMVQKNPKLLYNPFWRSLADRNSYSAKLAAPQSIGSYYYAADKIHRWRTFDQILFSSSFLGAGEWHLCEDETVIWEEPSWLAVGPGMSKEIDHLPIFGVLERQST